MKRFNDCFKAFISYIKGMNGCPDFEIYQFTFEYQGKQTDNDQMSDIKKAEKKFNCLLDNGHSWINITYDKVIKNCLFVTFIVSEANYREWEGKTNVNLCGPLIDINGEFMWAERNVKK